MVDDLAPLWPRVLSFNDCDNIRDPFDRDDGMRELHIIDSDGCLIFVG